jgi:hypothetical protein
MIRFDPIRGLAVGLVRGYPMKRPTAHPSGPHTIALIPSILPKSALYIDLDIHSYRILEMYRDYLSNHHLDVLI